MNRILTRIDHEGNPVVFLPDTYANGKLKAWYGQSNEEPVEVTIEYYKSTKDLDEKDEKQAQTKQRLKKQAEKKFNDAPVFLMQRFPRGMLKALKEVIQEVQQEQAEQPVPQQNVVIAPPVSVAEKQHYRAVKAVRVGRVWEVQDEQGETVEILTSKEAAMKALESQVHTVH